MTACRRTIPALLLLALAATALAAEIDPDAFTAIDPRAPEVTVTAARAGGGSLALHGRRLLQGSDEVYLPSASAAELFRARRSWQEDLRRLTLQVGERSFALTADSRLVTRDDGEVLLRTPALATEGDLWVPMEFYARVLGPGIRQTVSWDPGSLALNVGSAQSSANVTGLRVEELSRATALHVTCGEPLTYAAESGQPGYVTLTIRRGRIAQESVSLDRPVGLVESVGARQEGPDAVLDVKVNDLVKSYRTYDADGGREIVLVLEEEPPGVLPEPTPRGKLNLVMRGPEQPEAPRRQLQIRTVVIDPGHGGDETGRIGATGTMEKDVNLAIAQELKRWLERQSDVKVVLTRDADANVPLAQRAVIANEAGGDLFLSLHCNGWFNERAGGIETFFLSPAKTDREASIAREENTEATAPGNEDVEFILWDLVQNGFINESSDLAETMQAALCRDLGAGNRGVKQAGFRVLVGAYMPAVLIEMGFLSNPDEEKNLIDSDYQKKLARTIGQAVVEFRDRYSHLEASSNPQGDTGAGAAGAPGGAGATGGSTDPRAGERR